MKTTPIARRVLEIPMVTRARAAMVVGVSIDAVVAAAQRGEINPMRSPGGTWLLTVRDVQRLAEKFPASR